MAASQALIMDESVTFRDFCFKLFVRCRCGDKEAYNIIENLVACASDFSPEDSAVVKGYLGDLLLMCQTQLIPRNEKRAKELLSHISEYACSNLTCKHVQYLLGVFYLDCCSGMDTEAFKVIRQAANQGHCASLTATGYMYGRGMGTRINPEKACDYYGLAAAQGYPVAQRNMAIRYSCGSGCEKNDALAVEFYKKAADQGFSDAQLDLGVCYCFAWGVDENFVEAARYFKLAAEQGLAEAQFRLGMCYHYGRGVEKDLMEALRLCMLAERQKNASAAQYVGQAYDFGWGVEKNVVEAMRYYRKAVTYRDLKEDHERSLNYSADKVKSLYVLYRKAVSICIRSCQFKHV